MVIIKYQDQLQIEEILYNDLRGELLKYSMVRFITFVLILLLILLYYSQDHIFYLFAAIFLVAAFVVLIKLYSKLQWKLNIVKKKIELLKSEINFIKTGYISNDNGSRFVDSNHPFTFDLDIFGANSLYAFINRTVTFGGSNNLAKKLSQNQSERISDYQEAIKELSNKPSFRLQFQAVGALIKDDKPAYDKLSDWLKIKTSNPILYPWLLQILTVLPIVSYILSLILEHQAFTFIFSASLTINLILLLTFFKKIQKEISITQEIIDTFKKYGLLLHIVEEEKFHSVYLSHLQKQLFNKDGSSNKTLNQFSEILSSLDSIHNLFPAAIVNSISLYHMHKYNQLIRWKSSHSKHVSQWVDIISEMDALQSLAGFSYNNPTYIYPTISQNKQINFKALGHPLIAESYRITNDIDFADTFYILTGSNMSGKSTFLRTIGINLVLAMVGCPVCAENATIYPVQLWTSMRQNDALHKNFSYFFAEVKRLKTIFDQINEKHLFILLDEILKGINSEDKLNGSIEVSKKILRQKLNGVFATHDIEIAHLATEFENAKAINFQSKIENNDIAFDYKLREGICTSKSATFLLQREGVI
ncbi:MAG TPA: hypothetical protein PKD85_10415 [Saprospiraceae bacterium]|nr:hypothetical protein [Saprospiraceae bacterium]